MLRQKGTSTSVALRLYRSDGCLTLYRLHSHRIISLRLAVCHFLARSWHTKRGVRRLVYGLTAFAVLGAADTSAPNPAVPELAAAAATVSLSTPMRSYMCAHCILLW